MIPKIKLIANRVLIKQDLSDPVSAGGIILMRKEEEPSTKGTVIVVGLGMKDYTMTVKQGDHVLYSKDSGIEVTLDDGNNYLIMRETEIKMVLSSKK